MRDETVYTTPNAKQGYVAVTRFTKDATPEVKREFAVALVAALEAIGAPYGEDFLVTTTGYMDGVREDLYDAELDAKEARDRLRDAGDLIRGAGDMICDFRLGIRDLAELTELGEQARSWEDETGET